MQVNGTARVTWYAGPIWGEMFHSKRLILGRSGQPSTDFRPTSSVDIFAALNFSLVGSSRWRLLIVAMPILTSASASCSTCPPTLRSLEMKCMCSPATKKPCHASGVRKPTIVPSMFSYSATNCDFPSSERGFGDRQPVRAARMSHVPGPHILGP